MLCLLGGQQKGDSPHLPGLIIHRAQRESKSAWDLPKSGWFYASIRKPAYMYLYAVIFVATPRVAIRIVRRKHEMYGMLEKSPKKESCYSMKLIIMITHLYSFRVMQNLLYSFLYK